jgi:predicted permease
MKWRRLFRHPARTAEDVRRDIDEEMAFHLAMRTDALEREGLSREAARARAASEFGDIANRQVALETDGRRIEQRRRLSRFLSELLQDTRYGLRLLARSPGFSLAAIATITIAVGANTAVFGVINALLLKPLPATDPDALVRIEPGDPAASWLLYETLRERTGAFVDIAAFSTEVLTLGEPGATRRVIGEAVSQNYFPLLGVEAMRGRTFGPDDRALDHVVLSERLWRLHFGADEEIVGRAVTLDRRPYVVTGVMPALFRGLAPPGWTRDFWIPIESLPAHRQRLSDPTAAAFQLAGRLKDDVTAAQAMGSTQADLAQARRDDPRLPDPTRPPSLQPLSGLAPFRGVGAMVPLFLFVGMVTLLAALILVIGCANIAGLLYSRSAGRRQEIAVRIALGAGRGRLVRQLLTESLILAIAGGMGGIVLASWLTGAVHLATAQLPFPLEFDLATDWRVFSYALAVAAVAVIIFGLAPARRASRTDVVTALKDDTVSGRRQRARQVLVVAQVTACSVLLAWALLFARSLTNVTSVHPGFETDGVLLADVSVGETATLPRDEREARFMRLQEAAVALPQVESAGLAWAVPLTLSSRESFGVFLEGDERGAQGRPVMANRLTPGWFDALRIPIVAGRDFTWHDRAGSPEVAIVNRTLAQRFWQGAAIGKRLRFTGRRAARHDVEIVGVVGDSKYWTLGEQIEPTVYLPIRQADLGDDLALHIRTSNPEATARAVGQAMQRIAPDGFVEFTTLSDATAVALMPARVGATVTSAFAGVAVLLAALGIYGLVSYSVAQRTREIGVRRALGATTGDIVWMVLSSSLTLGGIGLLLGLALALLGAPALAGLVVGVSPTDQATLALAMLLVGSIVIAASVGPALRAATVEARTALNR